MDAIIDAAYFVGDQVRHSRESGNPEDAAKTMDSRFRGNDGGKNQQLIASDIVEAFERLAEKLDPGRDSDKIKRAREMADGLRYFTKDPVSSKSFNTEGKPWPLADVTVIDMGKFAQEGYEA